MIKRIHTNISYGFDLLFIFGFWLFSINLQSLEFETFHILLLMRTHGNFSSFSFIFKEEREIFNIRSPRSSLSSFRFYFSFTGGAINKKVRFFTKPKFAKNWGRGEKRKLDLVFS